MSEWITFGRLLKNRRCAAMLSRSKLAQLTHLSEATIKNTERGKQASQRTMLALYAVHELRLTASDLPEGVELKAMTGELFQRFQLQLVGCGVAQTAFAEVLAWSEQQVAVDAIKELRAWVEAKLRAVEQERRRLEGETL